MGMLDGRVAIITGAGRGIGREHALLFAAEGAKVVVNDLGGAMDGSGGDLTPAQQTVADIKAMGGEAIVNGDDVSDWEGGQRLVNCAVEAFGDLHILVNNAGILRDKTFAKQDMTDFRLVLEVHLFGAVNCTKACWEQMRAQKFGRIVMTTSSAGLYGNFGQAAYSTAKAGLVGLMKTLAKEGAKNNIRVNALSPAAATRMTEGLLTPEQLELLSPDRVAVGVCFLASEGAPTGTVLTAGAGSFAVARIVETQGKYFPEEEQTPESIAAHWSAISAAEGQVEILNVEDQTIKFLDQAIAVRSRDQS